MDFASSVCDAGTAFVTSTPAISPKSAKRSATFTICLTSRSGWLTSGPATIRGTHTPVWYDVPFDASGSNGAFTVGAYEPLSPTMTIIVLLAAGSYVRSPFASRPAMPSSTSRRPSSWSIASIVWLLSTRVAASLAQSSVINGTSGRCSDGGAGW
jgi:hypothetical protein